MITVIHTPADEEVDEDDFYRFPAGGRRMEMDWARVIAVFQSALEGLGWDADLEVRPEKQHVLVCVQVEYWDRVGRTMSAFDDIIVAELGIDQFMSIGIDYLTRHEPSLELALFPDEP
jgi:hypothetical protein